MRIKLRWKKLQKDEYIFFEKSGRRTYLVHSKKDLKKSKRIIDDMVIRHSDWKDKNEIRDAI